MTLQRTKSEIIIRLPSNFDFKELQAMLDFIRYKQIVSKSKASKKDITKLAKEAKKEWWSKNKRKILS